MNDYLREYQNAKTTEERQDVIARLPKRMFMRDVFGVFAPPKNATKAQMLEWCSDKRWRSLSDGAMDQIINEWVKADHASDILQWVSFAVFLTTLIVLNV